mmetsp:Transcript_3622/g.6611  ORF Transcript_3622/g.6611 Transcript_3622/m.6611 type:complete len:338 (-) Transcript_3622:14-1027(-)
MTEGIRSFSAYDDFLRQHRAREAAPSETVTVGFVRCPLCKLPAKSQKRFALGRGLRMHFASVHAGVDPGPWLDAAEAGAAKGAVDGSRGTANHDGSRPPVPPGLVAASEGDLVELQLLYKRGDWFLEQTDHHGSHAVHWAAGGGHLEVVRWLVEAVDPASAAVPVSKRKRRDGRLPIHWAARNDRLHVLDYLLALSSGSPDKATFDGTTPLHLACFGGSTATAQRLLEAGACADMVNQWGCSAVHWAAMGGSVAVLSMLAEKGADFGALQKEGHSPLHKAAHRGHLDAVAWLLNGPYSGAEARSLASQRDTSGLRPSDIARVTGQDECHSVLKDAGC